jgi:nucleoside 2-deoxyribosyltransferase
MHNYYILYLAHPISGLSYDQVVDYYRKAKEDLGLHYDIFCPMTGKGYLRTEINFKAVGYNNPVSTNHAIKERDKWMIKTSDIVFIDLTGADRVSIGCCMELAWADMLDKHSIVVMEKENIHRHAFVLECADLVFETYEEAVKYLIALESNTFEDYQEI